MKCTRSNPARREFLKSTGAVSTACLAPVALVGNVNAKLENRARRGPISKSGSDGAVIPPFEVRVLNNMGFGFSRGFTGSATVNPDNIADLGFEASTDPQETDDLAHFLSLGETDDERLAAYVEEQLAPTQSDPELDERLAEHAAFFAFMNRTQEDLFSTYECASDGSYRRPLFEVEKFSMTAACYSRWQLRELMVDFWHNHLSVFGRLDRDTYVSWASWDRDVMRANVFGNFYELIYASAKHATMLRYLDNYVNGRDGAINENYCRELFELHCLGSEVYVGNENPRFVEALAENPYTALGDPELEDLSLGFLADPNLDIAAVYTDDDVLTAAQSMTGWRYDDENTETSCGSGLFQTAEDEHNKDSTKAVLMLGVAAIPSGLDAETEGRLIVKLAAYHPATANHIARKLCQRLIADEPPEAVVAAAAQTFFEHRTSPDQIARTLRTILLSDEFKDAANWGTKTRRPFEYVVAAMRAAGCDYTWREGDEDTRSFFTRYNGCGQRLFDWRTPDGFPDKRAHWEGSTTLVQNWRTVDWLLDRHVSDETRRIMRAIDITLASIAGDPTPRLLAEFWCTWALGFRPESGWTGHSGYEQAPTAIGRTALRFITQDFPEDQADSRIWPADDPIEREALTEDRGPYYWRSRLTGLVKVILWSPQFMQR